MKKITVRPQWYLELDSCIRCGKCDHRCPNDAHPSNLMRECLEHKRRSELKVPSSMAYGINGLGTEGWGANFFKDAYKGLAKVDKKILRNWAIPKKSKDILWIGCTDRMSPRAVEESYALRDVEKFGGPDDCCGVWAIQGGLLDEGYRIAKRLVNRILENRFERLVVGCGHCQKVLTRIMPDHAFDYVILNQSMQEIKKADFVIRESLREEHKVIVGFPNFAYISARLTLFFQGKTPINAALPHYWFDTPNIRFLTIRDFIDYCAKKNIHVEQQHFVGKIGRVHLLPNLLAQNAIFVITK